MRTYSKEEVEKARAFLKEDGRKPTWFRFDETLAEQFKLIFETEERTDKNGNHTGDRMTALSGAISGTILWGILEYFETGEIPVFVREAISENPNKIVSRMLDGILQRGCEMVDNAYVEYATKIQAGSRGGIARAENFLKQLDDAFSDDQTGDILPAQE